MKRTIAFWAGAAAIALLTLGTDNLRADATNLVTISVTAFLQGGTNDVLSAVRFTEKISPPQQYKINTKQILAWAAQDEYAEGNYSAPTFPPGAQLAEVYNDQTGWSYQVLDSHNQFLANVSDVVSSSSSTNSVISGDIDMATGLYTSTVTDLRLKKFAYNDSAVTAISNRPPAGVDFYLRGLETRTFIDSTPNKFGDYTQSYTGKMTNGAGEGVWNGTTMIIEGELEYQASLKEID